MDYRLSASIFILALIGLSQCVPVPDSDMTSPRLGRSAASGRSGSNAGTSGDTRTNGQRIDSFGAMLLERILGKLNATKERMAKVIVDFEISDETTIGVYPPNRRFPVNEPENHAGEVIADSHYYLRCFISPLAEAQENETHRNVSDGLPSYWEEFYASFGDIADAANDIYNLVIGTSLPGYNNHDIPRIDDPCPPLDLEGLVDFQDSGLNYTDRALTLGAIANDLHNLCFDLDPYVTLVLGN